MGTGRTFRMLAALALPAVIVVVGPNAWAGINQGPVTVDGAVVCVAATGHQVVYWTLNNPSGEPITIDSSALDATAMTHQGPIDSTVTLTPSSVPNGGSATGQTEVTGDGTGDLSIDITFTIGASDPLASGVVALPGGCLGPATTSTTATSTSLAPTTTAPASRAAAVTAAPSFTG